MSAEAAKQCIINGQASLGIELGSTRIKAVLIDEAYRPIAAGGFDWENKLENGIWTYHLDDALAGLQAAYKMLAEEVQRLYGVPLQRPAAIGISAMMHGYLVFNAAGEQLVPFRTWRNTCTEQAAAALTGAFGFNIPQRWSIAHLYQAALNGETHLKDVALLTTLAGYIHERLTGQRAIGMNEASGMFPLDSDTGTYNAAMVSRFDGMMEEYGVPWRLAAILPAVLPAGAEAGILTPEGARLLDPSGALQPGILLCPPEGDAGTGMVATNSIAPRTGNISAGTSIFAMTVLEKQLSKVYPEVDMIATPAGAPVAMVHGNNCTSDLDAWVRLFDEVLNIFGAEVEKSELYNALYKQAENGEADGGGLLTYNYISGEHITGMEEGRPLLARLPDGGFTLPNLMRTLLYSTVASMKLGMDILTLQEHVHLDCILGHGGLFKTKGVGQRMMAAALEVPVAVMESAGEGGAWGIALLAAYARHKQPGETLSEYLSQRVFAGFKSEVAAPNLADVEGFKAYMRRYTQGLAIERAAVEHFKQ